MDVLFVVLVSAGFRAGLGLNARKINDFVPTRPNVPANGATARPYKPRLETAPWQIDCRAND